MKKLTRKLIPAFAMLLLSAVLMSTASFAWFTMNNQVTANGIQVTVTAPAALWISQGNSNRGEFTASINLANENTNTSATGKFEPVTPVFADGVPTFYKPNAEWIKKIDAANGQLTNNGQVVTFDPETHGTTSVAGHYLDTFYLLYDGAAGDQATLTVMADVSCSATTPDGIWDALRIAVVIGTEVVTLDPDALNGESVNYKSGEFTTKIAAQVDATKATAVKAYVWFDGTDDACVASQAYNKHAFTINLTFNADPYTAPASGT